MILRSASKFINALDFDSREQRDEIKKVIRLKFLEFCDENNIQNTLQSYREYRSVVRSIYGFDLIEKRPIKEYSKIETEISLF